MRTASCHKKNVFPGQCEIGHLDSDEEEELGASIYKSSVTARKKMGRVAVLDQSVDISTNSGKNDLECENELNNRDIDVNQLDVANQYAYDPVEGTDLPPNEEVVHYQTRATRKRNQTQLSNSKAGKVTNDRAKRLDGIGFIVGVQDHGSKWDVQFAALQRYKNVYGDCLVPQIYSDDPKLARWVRQQRTNAKAGKLTNDRMNRLESIGFVVDVLAYLWGEQFSALQCYKNEHGDCLVPHIYSDDPRLGHWVYHQRRDAKAGKVTDHRMKRLFSIGFVFDVYDCVWDEQFAALQRYKNKHGNCLVPVKYSDDPPLGGWVHHQRHDAKAGTLADDRVKRLESVGFEFRVR